MRDQRLETRNSISDARFALCLFCFLFSIYLLTFSGRYHSSDEMSMLAVTDSLARRGGWDVELIHWMGEQQASLGPDSLLYSRKGIGTTLAALPAYWLAVQEEQIGNVEAAMWTNGVVTALTGMLVYLFLRRLRYGMGASLGTALAFGLGTMAWPYARYLFSESLTGLGLMASAYFLLRYHDEGDRASPLLAGGGLGAALLARLNNAIVAPFLGLLLLFYLYRRYGRDWRARPRASSGAWIAPLVLFALPMLAALAIAGWYNWLRFGSPWNTGYLPGERFSTPFFEGLYGLTFSPGKGLFWYNPLFFVSVAVWPAFFRRHRAEALLAAAVVLSNVAFYAPWYLWWAGHSWGPRFLVTILPFAALPLAPALEAATRRRAVALGVGVLAVASLVVQVLGVAVDFNLYLDDIYARLGLYHPATLFDAAYSPLLRQWTYLQPESLDLAWARGGTVNWGGLACGLVLVGLSSVVLWAAWRGRMGRALGIGLLVLLALGAYVSLRFFYAPDTDVGQAAALLARMEQPGEVGALADPLLTETWQDAYDGGLWVWGVRSRGEIIAQHTAVWTIGSSDPDPAAARFQVGAVSLSYYPPPGDQFDDTRIWGGPSQSRPRLDNLARLVAERLPGDVLGEPVGIQRGKPLPLALYWRALATTDISYTIFVQVINESGIKVGQVDRLPCDGGCPTTTWRPGDLVGEWLEIPIHSDAPSGRYQLIAGMYDLATGKNLDWTDDQGHVIGPYYVLDTVQLQP
jgi:hypothetical protein